ncbi:MAG: hypothetical protein ACKOD5_12075 [Chthoniobacterales bacterium]
MKRKTLSKLFLASVAFATLPVVAHAGIVTIWDTGYFNSADGYVSGSSLTDMPNTAPAPDQFKTTDGYNGLTGTGDNSLLDFLPGTTFGGGLGSGSGNSSALFGGAVWGTGPGITNPAIYRNFSMVPGLPTGSPVTFSIDYRYISYTNSFYDNWSFDLRNAAGTTSLLNIFIDTESQPDLVFVYANGVGIGAYTNYAGGGATNGALMNISATLLNNTWTVGLSSIDATTVGGDVMGFVTNVATVKSGTLLRGTAADFESVYLSWLLTEGNINDYGENYMVFNQMNVLTEVPEPGTWATAALLACGLAYGIYRRRKLAATDSPAVA